MRIGWIEDSVPVPGGAELSMRALRESAPGEVIRIFSAMDRAAGPVEPQVDVWVVGNCTRYSADFLVPLLQTAPVVKRVADWWLHGDPVLREWLLKYAAKLVFLSSSHIRRLSPLNHARSGFHAIGNHSTAD